MHSNTDIYNADPDVYHILGCILYTSRYVYNIYPQF